MNNFENEPRITIVVPVFNCEAYIEDCIRSIINQTYKNLEIIIVDDGSTDSTGEICDFLKKEDDRILVIHKSNAGVAKARNEGAKLSNSKYIAFIDGDDIVHPIYIQYLYSLLKKNNADIAICGIQTFYDKSELSKNKLQEVYPIEIYSGEEALEKMLYRKDISASPCVKIVKKNICEKNLFPEKTLFEDLGVVYKWFAASTRVVYSPMPLYYYLTRIGSRQHSSFSIEKWDLIDISEEILRFVQREYPDCIAAGKNRLFVSCLQILRDIPIIEFPDEYHCLKKRIINLRGDVIKDYKSKKSTRILALLSFINIRLLKEVGFLCNNAIYFFRIRKAF